MLTIEPEFSGKYAFLHTGFRPFFLLAMASALVLGLLWAGIYSFGWTVLRADYPLLAWHAHEMLFGYTLAVVSGFLLTAVRNWTHIPTAEGSGLLLLAGIWLFGRLLPFVAGLPFWYLGLHELLYLLLLLYLVARPIVIRKQWKQLAILGKLALLVVASVSFHLGLMGVWKAGINFGLYLALYLLIGLILTMGRRVIPSFIENTVRNGFHALNDAWLDRMSLVLFLLFTVAELGAVAFGDRLAMYLGALLALVQFVLHAFRLYGWYHRHIWQHALLWSLYLAYAWITGGFLLVFLSAVAAVSPWVAVHAFAYGGIGLITLGMMSRVALGHTGRNVFAPPAAAGGAAALLVGGAFVRVVLVALWPAHYDLWILAAILIWMAAFAWLLAVYLPMLLHARIDRRYG